MAKIRIVRLCTPLASGVARLWRRCFPCREVHANVVWNPFGRPMTRRAVQDRILGRESFDPAGSFVAVAGGRVVGFCIAAMPPSPEARDGYLCGLAVAPRFRRRGIGSRLLRRAERYLARCGARTVRVSSEGNPVPLLIGVPTNYEATPFLLNRGFRNPERRLLQVMTQDTTRYRFPRAMQERIRRLERAGIRIGHLEVRERSALDRLLTKHFQGWHRGIMERVTREPAAPISVAVRKRTVLGFAGPFGVAASGAGHFFALGVAPAERRQGIGAALFHRMSAELKALGAKAVNLTTELNNPAQDLYAAAGFRTRCVVDCGMRKDLASSQRQGVKPRGVER